MIRQVAAVTALMLCSSLVAEPIDVEYSRFYSHLRKLDNEDTQALQFAFGFVHVNEARLCHIESVEVITPKQTIPLTVSTEQRFTVPYEKALKLADSVIRINLDDAANQCDMSVQLETKPDYLRAAYSGEELQFLFNQYSAFFNEMGSFLSFMMPSVKGLTIHFENSDLDAVVANAPDIVNGVLVIDKQWIERGNGLQLPVKPLRVTAQASRN